MLHNFIIGMRIDFKVIRDGEAIIDALFKHTAMRSRACDSVDGGVWVGVEPFAVDEAITFIPEREECEHTVDAVIVVKDEQVFGCDIRLDEVLRWINVAPLRGVAVFLHIFSCSAVDSQDLGQILSFCFAY